MGSGLFPGTLAYAEFRTAEGRQDAWKITIIAGTGTGTGTNTTMAMTMSLIMHTQARRAAAAKRTVTRMATDMATRMD
jgi:hypothetical protein